MTIHDVIRDKFQRSIDLYDELIAGMPDDGLAAKLPGLPSNTVGEQLWCVIGARESYSRAIAAGRWMGFSCSVSPDQCTRKSELAGALARSGSDVLEAVAVDDSVSDNQTTLILDLLEHEAAHHGQLIRYLYALRLPIPEAWKSRYALT